MAEEQSAEHIAMLQKQNCIFCKIIKEEIPSKKVHEDSICTAILDINPANEGHVILLPKEHYQIMPQVPKDVIMHMGIIAKKVSKALLLSTLGKSTSIFVANGAVAGQKAPHFMIHIIPRKSEKEFFVIPSKQLNASDLDKVKIVITKKIENLTGKKQYQEIPASIQVKEENRIYDEMIEPEKIISPIPPLKHPRKIARVGIKKEKGYLYYIDTEGDVARVPMARGGKKRGKSEKVEIEENEEYSSDNSDGSPSRLSLDDISKMLLGGK